MASEEFRPRIGAVSAFAAAVEVTDSTKASTTRMTKVRLSNMVISCVVISLLGSHHKVAETSLTICN
jgi:hypothetical protein